jgi:hypothetical protein
MPSGQSPDGRAGGLPPLRGFAPRPPSSSRFLAADLALGVLLAVLGFLAPLAAARFAAPVTLNLGPNDGAYVRGFREDWERVGRTRFHWTTLSSSIRLPVRLSGEGHVLRLRARRHFVEPAWVRLSAEGRTVAGPFEIAADSRVPYRILEFPLPRLEGRAPFELGVEAHSANPRPLGLAIDWIEIERRGKDAQVRPMVRLQLALMMVLAAAFAAARLAGASRAWALAHAAVLLAAACAGTLRDVVAADRIVREGASAYLAAAALAVLLARWAPTRRLLALEDTRRAAAVLVLLTLTALAIRLVLLLHPQFFYPDVRVHANVAWQLHRRGLVAFLREFTASQYRFSLGLQFENGHWYAFPYPPAFYLMCWPLLRLGCRPEVAVSLLAAVVNSFEAFLVYAIGRRLRLPTAVAVAGAAAPVVLPLFMARLTLAYFPAMVGHAVDALVILYLLWKIDELQRTRVWITLGALLALALLTYTQSLLNFGLLLPLFLLVQIALDRAPGARARQAGLAAAGLLGVVLSLAVFYGRYVPTFLDMQRGVPMPEEQILIEKLKQPAAADEDVQAEEGPDDPFAGPTLDPWRGARKAAWRLVVFYGWFAPAVVAGLCLLFARFLGGAAARFAGTWALLYLLLNLASGGLPGPNLVRYNKDLEIVAPLFCLALGAIAAWLWELGRVWARALAAVYAASYYVCGAGRAVRYWLEKFVMER